MTRQDFLNSISKIFGGYGIKTVSRTDINKSAYVPNMEQKTILSNLGHNPENRRDFDIKELFTNQTLHVSYYATLRDGSGRAPEPRMGLTDLISYLNEGDEILLTNDSTDIYIFNLSKLNLLPQDTSSLEEVVLTSIDEETLESIVNQADETPSTEEKIITVYPRNSAVRVSVKKRAMYLCEFPSCTYTPFIKSDGEQFVEVHHIIPLSEGGRDKKENMASLCPICHRKLHYAENKETLIEELKRHIDSLG